MKGKYSYNPTFSLNDVNLNKLNAKIGVKKIF
jgi:hypothetical protein